MFFRPDFVIEFAGPAPGRFGSRWHVPMPPRRVSGVRRLRAHPSLLHSGALTRRKNDLAKTGTVSLSFSDGDATPGWMGPGQPSVSWTMTWIRNSGLSPLRSSGRRLGGEDDRGRMF